MVFVTDMERKRESRIVINVCGEVYETQPSTLSRFPETLLGSVMGRAKHYDPCRRQLIFDRDITSFEAILFYYQSNGILSKPCWISMEVFERECRYFGIDEMKISSMKHREGYAKTSRPNYENYTNSFCEKVWIFLEYPESSKFAKIYSLFSLFLVIASNIAAFAMTIPELQTPKKIYPLAAVAENYLPLFEFVLQAIFASEFFTRLTFSRCKSEIFSSFMFWIDFFAIFPYFVITFLVTDRSVRFRSLGLFNTMRIIRVFRWTRHYKTLYTVMNILTRCSGGFIMFTQSIIVVCFLFASLGYFAELGLSTSHFTSLPQSMWWAIQTMVCLGYGDIVPQTITGKIAGSCVAIIGAITLTVPLISIGGKYMYMYTNTFSLHMGRDMTFVAKESIENLKNKRSITSL